MIVLELALDSENNWKGCFACSTKELTVPLKDRGKKENSKYVSLSIPTSGSGIYFESYSVVRR